MGVELDVLVGHPDHDLLFLAAQVARDAGLKYPSNAAQHVRKLRDFGPVLVLKELPLGDIQESWSFMPNGCRYISCASLFSEALLLRGHAPQSEPFRKWVTEEVLPTIHKTGQYNAEESTNPAILRT